MKKEYNVKEDNKEFDIYLLAKDVIKTSLFSKANYDNYYDYKMIYIDLDSVLSRIIDLDLPDDLVKRKEIASFIMEQFKEFFMMYDKSAKINIYYAFHKENKFTKIYPNWCKSRYARYDNESIMDFIRKVMIPKLKLFSKVVPNVSIIPCKDSTMLTISREIEFNGDFTESIVLSRDPHFQCILAYYPIAIYDGKNLYNRGTRQGLNNIPNVHYSLIPYYYLMVGMSRNEYKGVNKVGPNTFYKLLEKDKKGIIDFSNNKIKEAEKYKDIFLIYNLI